MCVCVARWWILHVEFRASVAGTDPRLDWLPQVDGVLWVGKDGGC